MSLKYKKELYNNLKKLEPILQTKDEKRSIKYIKNIH